MLYLLTQFIGDISYANENTGPKTPKICQRKPLSHMSPIRPDGNIMQKKSFDITLNGVESQKIVTSRGSGHIWQHYRLQYRRRQSTCFNKTSPYETERDITYCSIFCFNVCVLHYFFILIHTDTHQATHFQFQLTAHCIGFSYNQKSA